MIGATEGLGAGTLLPIAPGVSVYEQLHMQSVSNEHKWVKKSASTKKSDTRLSTIFLINQLFRLHFAQHCKYDWLMITF